MNAPFLHDELDRWKLQHAKAQSALATVRLQGMKNRANIDPPRPAAGVFPYPARTCAEWGRYDAWLERRGK